jgi:hypothetical protein
MRKLRKTTAATRSDTSAARTTRSSPVMGTRGIGACRSSRTSQNATGRISALRMRACGSVQAWPWTNHAATSQEANAPPPATSADLRCASFT